MIDKLNKHRKKTCLRQKEAWKETIDKRLSECEEDINSIPIVIWGLEASPSYFDSSPPYKNRIETTPGVSPGQYLLHKNYLYNDLVKNGNNYGVRIIKNWINKEYAPDTKKEGQNKKPEYSYKSLITQLSGIRGPNRHFSLHQVQETIQPQNPIHLVYDIFPEWHGLPVTSKMRAACYNKSYMCSKVDDFEEHVMRIQSAFSKCNGKVKPGGIHFVWLGTKQTNERYPMEPACHQFFCCLNKKIPKIKFWYNPGGFVTKNELNKIDCPEDFEAIGVPEDWSKHIVRAGYDTVEALREQKPLDLCMELNTFKKKNKLDIPALSLEEVESWFDD